MSDDLEPALAERDRADWIGDLIDALVYGDASLCRTSTSCALQLVPIGRDDCAGSAEPPLPTSHRDGSTLYGRVAMVAERAPAREREQLSGVPPRRAVLQISFVRGLSYRRGGRRRRRRSRRDSGHRAPGSRGWPSPSWAAPFSSRAESSAELLYVEAHSRDPPRAIRRREEQRMPLAGRALRSSPQCLVAAADQRDRPRRSSAITFGGCSGDGAAVRGAWRPHGKARASSGSASLAVQMPESGNHRRAGRAGLRGRRRRRLHGGERSTPRSAMGRPGEVAAASPPRPPSAK